MNFKLKTLVAAAAMAFACAGAHAQISGNVVKIGVLNDQSGLYADLGGQGSVVAAKMAVEDFKAKDKSLNVAVIVADPEDSLPLLKAGELDIALDAGYPQLRRLDIAERLLRPLDL